MKRAPTTKREGEARGIAMLRELEKMNWDHNAPIRSSKMVDARIRDALTWRPEARRGFTFIISEWLRTDVQGFGYNLNDYERVFKRDGRASTK